MFEAHLDGEAEFMRDVQAFTRDVQQGLETAVMHACQVGANEAKRGAFKDQSGAMRKRIHWRLIASSLAEATGEFASPVEYSSFVEDGTKPHVIRPRSGKFLRFKGSGGMVYARSVRHPGSRARKMFARSVPKIQSELQRIVGRILGR